MAGQGRTAITRFLSRKKAGQRKLGTGLVAIGLSYLLIPPFKFSFELIAMRKWQMPFMLKSPNDNSRSNSDFIRKCANSIQAYLHTLRDKRSIPSLDNPAPFPLQ